MSKNVLILSHSDEGGAAEAMLKLSLLIKELGHEVAMLVDHKGKNHDFVIKYFNEQGLAAKIISKFKNGLNSLLSIKKTNLDSNYYFFDINEKRDNVNIDRILNIIPFKPDYIIVGMTSYFMNSTDILKLQKRTNAQVYNITVDMTHFTGGCHYAWDCTGYIRGCDTQCPAILSEKDRNLAQSNFIIKLANARKGNFKIIAGSGHTLTQAKESKIYGHQIDVKNINSIIDTRVFNSKQRMIAKSVFNLPSDKLLILCGSQNFTEKRKGFEYLLESLKALSRKLSVEILSKIEIIVVSNTKSDAFESLPFDKRYLDYIRDYRLLSLLYQSADLFINSSIEDSGPMMVSEALACGTPVIGFDTGIVTNMVIDNYNGYKVPNKNTQELTVAIEKFINLTSAEHEQFSKNAVTQVEKYSSFEYAKQILEQIII